MDFVQARVLRSKFAVFGHFYSVQVAPGRTHDCRSVLEIVESAHHPKSTAELSKRRPDAVVIMMNPGSSRPLIEVKSRIDANAIHELRPSLVPTKPDTTQFQVMRVMHYCNWQHVRVLNLSDLRCSKSSAFIRLFEELENEHEFDAHSVFASRRAEELASKLTQDTPVICAWGVSPRLDPLIYRCTANLSIAAALVGLAKEGARNRYFHPLPRLQSLKMEWVNRMVDQCQALGTQAHSRRLA